MKKVIWIILILLIIGGIYLSQKADNKLFRCDGNMMQNYDKNTGGWQDLGVCITGKVCKVTSPQIVECIEQ